MQQGGWLPGPARGGWAAAGAAGPPGAARPAHLAPPGAADALSLACHAMQAQQLERDTDAAVAELERSTADPLCVDGWVLHAQGAGAAQPPLAPLRCCLAWVGVVQAECDRALPVPLPGMAV